MWLSWLGAAVPDLPGPSLPWGTACLLLREAFERLATGRSSLQALPSKEQGVLSLLLETSAGPHPKSRQAEGGEGRCGTPEGAASSRPPGLHRGLVEEATPPFPKASFWHSHHPSLELSVRILRIFPG